VCERVPSTGQVSLSVCVGWGDTTCYATDLTLFWIERSFAVLQCSSCSLFRTSPISNLLIRFLFTTTLYYICSALHALMCQCAQVMVSFCNLSTDHVSLLNIWHASRTFSAFQILIHLLLMQRIAPRRSIVTVAILLSKFSLLVLRCLGLI